MCVWVGPNVGLGGVMGLNRIVLRTSNGWSRWVLKAVGSIGGLGGGWQ